jgi:alkylhydroperoxidase family enzyme
VQQVLDDDSTAPIDAKLRATLRLLRKMTLDHRNLGVEDVRAVLAAGVSREAINDALEVAFLFNIYDRLADSMGWHVPAPASGYYQVVARRLIERGYRG